MQSFKELLANKSLNKSLMINALIPALIIVVYLSLFLGPKIKETFRLLPEASRLKTKIVNTEKEWTNIDLFNARISRLDEKLDYYERRLPEEKEIASLLKFLSDSAKKLNVRLTEIKPVGQDKHKKAAALIYEQVPILLRAECRYHELGRFLNKLESADRFMKITELKITANPPKANHNVELIVVTYVMER